MKTTSLTEYSNLLLTIYRQAQELPVHEFQDCILSAIKPSLPFDSSMWGTARMTDQGIDIHSLHLHNTTQAMIDAYEKVKHLDKAAMRVTQTPTATIAFNTGTDFPGAEMDSYREFLHKFRHENMLITSDIHPVTRFAQWVSLYRADPRQVCTAQETELLACLAPHLMQALAINRLVHLDRLTGDTAREKWAVAIADSRGVVYHADPRFRQLLRSEWRMDSGEERLPQALLERLLAEDSQLTGERVVLRRSLERGLLFLKARAREDVDNLSAREFLIARLLVSGLTQKEVAARLDRSPETVRSHVKGIFDKLDINNVAMLAPMLALRE
ncbi:LuxR C-terminal-related transcriptional regulator [uncultured Ramlibacter sp.]|uniref:helix-turn-helix transcriptional regulator n=1 Tax=uncultured Ramlibacter sp. TaxID=260755 RepID=UPI002638A50B|nr:LuxR C-terminal-related transcriptional regulator [uncultured Ramlibacter sp.]